MNGLNGNNHLNILGVNIVLDDPQAQPPNFASEGAAGGDLYAVLPAPEIIDPGCRKLISTGIRVAVPAGYEMQVRPRSGLALKSGITVLNSPGTIDSDYRGVVGVILMNHSTEPFTVNPGDRIAQAVFAPYMVPCFFPVDSLDETERGDGGFGSSGKN